MQIVYLGQRGSWKAICHFGNERETGAEMRPAFFWGDRYWKRAGQLLVSFFYLILVTVPEVNSAQSYFQLVPTCSTRSAQTQHTVSANNSRIYVYSSIHYEGRELLSYRDAKRKDTRTSHVFIAYYSIWSSFYLNFFTSTHLKTLGACVKTRNAPFAFSLARRVFARPSRG